MNNDQEKLDKLLEELDQLELKLRGFAWKIMKPGTGMFILDMLAVAVIRRSMSLLYGFVTLIRSQNFHAAAHLVRPHLDNYLRFYAVWLVDNPEEFAQKVLSGERINQLRDRKKKLMRDDYLLSFAIKDYPWMESVYKETSGFIHLSSKHIFSGTEIDLEDRTVKTFVQKMDRNVSVASKIEGALCMRDITTCVMFLLHILCQAKERDLTETGDFTVRSSGVPNTLDPLEEFNFKYSDEFVAISVEHFMEDTFDRYLITLKNGYKFVIAPAGQRKLDGSIVWVQAVTEGEPRWSHKNIQAMGEALEKEPWWKTLYNFQKST